MNGRRWEFQWAFIALDQQRGYAANKVKKNEGRVLLNAHYAFLREFGHIEDKF